MIKLSEVCDIIGDGLHGTPIFSDDGDYYFVNGNNLFNGKIQVSKDTKKCDESQYLLYKKPLNERTILLSINGTIGNLAYYNGENVILGKSACYLNIKENYDKKYMYYVFLNNDFQKYIKQYATGTTIKNTGLQTIRDYTLSIPDIEEQQAIADVLSSFDDKIELNNQIIKNLEEQAQSLYKHWFVDFEFPDKDGKPYKSNGGKFKESELGLIPEGWVVRKLHNLIVKNNNKFTNQEDWKDLKIIDLSVMPQFSLNIKTFNKGESFTTNIYKLNEYDLLFGSIRSYFGKAGFSPIEGAVAGTVHCFNPKNKDNFSFLLELITSKDFIDKTVKLSSGTKMPVINWETFCNIEICTSDGNIEKLLNEIIIDNIIKIKNLILENQKLAQARDYLLPKLMNGEIKVEK